MPSGLLLLGQASLVVLDRFRGRAGNRGNRTGPRRQVDAAETQRRVQYEPVRGLHQGPGDGDLEQEEPDSEEDPPALHPATTRAPMSATSRRPDYRGRPQLPGRAAPPLPTVVPFEDEADAFN